MLGFMQPCDPIRVEFQIAQNAKLISVCRTVGELKKKYKSLEFVKYIYRDPVDDKLKGINPPSDVPLVAKAYLTVAGDLKTIIELTKLATSQ